MSILEPAQLLPGKIRKKNVNLISVNSTLENYDSLELEVLLMRGFLTKLNV